MSGGLTYLEAVRRALAEEMERDERVLILGQDVGGLGGAFGATAGLRERFGADRVRDTPISESATVGVAVGLALEGMRPVVEMQFLDFLSSAWNMVVNWVAKARYRQGYALPLVIRGPQGGGVHGGPYHSQCMEGFLTHVPGLRVVAPSTARDALGMLKAAVRHEDPVLFLEHKYLYRRLREEIPSGEEILVPLDRARRRREGEGMVLLCWGAMVEVCLEAAEELERGEGISAEVLDLRCLQPLDEEAVLSAARRTGRVLVVEEDTRTGGLGAEVAARVAERAFDWLDAPVMRVGAPDSPTPFAPALEKAWRPGVEQVVAKARDLNRY